MSRPWARSCTAAAVALCVVAGAAAPSPGEVAPEVEKILAEGEALEAAGRYAQAVAVYRKVVDLSPGPGTPGPARLTEAESRCYRPRSVSAHRISPHA